MLQLQRASAGSGKTYTLAKKYIWFLIAVRRHDGKWRLRSPKEIPEALAGILAITFTNKATNEMKQRIVEKLADLARARLGTLSEEEAGKIAYLNDFSRDLGTTPAAIGQACQDALSALLNDYSRFKVSTIDSFFQTILRTFAYESNLNDSYQVEIDTDYLATAAVDATLDDINSRTDESSASFWMDELIREDADSGKTSWNVFQKSNRNDSIYTRLRKAVMKLENEDYKEIKESLDAYFDSPGDGSDPLQAAYTNARDMIRRPLEEALEKARKEARSLKALFRKFGLDPAVEGHRYLKGHLEKLDRLRFNQTEKTNIFAPLRIGTKDSALKKGVASEGADMIDETAARMYEAYSEWLGLRERPEWRHWAVYSPLLPLLGLLGAVRRRMRDFLDAANMIQLGETNAMLRRIIGDDDAPFIYERLGSYIDHYLIDEFQDTSRLQWENLLPLLRESESRGEDNLIIGDAKQSIYRFRNADPSLISEAVPQAFPRHLATGLSKADNTNWRSDRTIVEFNNFFFHFLIETLSGKTQGTVSLEELYRNVVQYASHRERKGYVEISFLTPGDDDAVERKRKADKSKEEKLKEEALRRIGPLTESLLARGYRQRDIAFLVDTNELGKEVIRSLVEYNASLGKGGRRIEFISEESLLVSSSEAVGIIISVLDKMANGSDRRRRAAEGKEEGTVKADWDSIRCNFSFYALRHPELTPAEQLEGFLSEESPDDAINSMLADMQTVALPALVEAITENFVPPRMRGSQAVFIAALQDMVLEFCSRGAADIPSFLTWWNAKGQSRSISSPEGTDAVQVMTVHKSKGLEFKCVIIPFANSPFIPTSGKSEWKWVSPASCLEGFGLPPFLPVETRSALAGTEHEAVWTRYHDLVMMDRLNSIYVAFTRAVSELYVFTGKPVKSGSARLGEYLYGICRDAETLLDGTGETALAEYMPPAEAVTVDDTADTVTFGSLPSVCGEETGAPSVSRQERTIREYGVDSSPAILHYVECDDETGTTMPEASDTDPRSEGNILHSILEKVRVASDLHKAILSVKMKGLATERQAAKWEKMLGEAISGEPAAGWFHPTWKVLNERPILFPHAPNLRPDRVLLSPDRKKAVIIDYKFGAIPDDNSHRRQVAEYITAFKEATSIHDVSGFVWYVRQKTIIAVTGRRPEKTT